MISGSLYGSWLLWHLFILLLHHFVVWVIFWLGICREFLVCQQLLQALVQLISHGIGVHLGDPALRVLGILCDAGRDEPLG